MVGSRMIKVSFSNALYLKAFPFTSKHFFEKLVFAQILFSDRTCHVESTSENSSMHIFEEDETSNLQVSKKKFEGVSKGVKILPFICADHGQKCWKLLEDFVELAGSRRAYISQSKLIKIKKID